MFQSSCRYTRCRVGQQLGLCLWRWFNSQIFFFCVRLFLFVCWRISSSYHYENTYDDDGGVVWAIMKQVVYAHRLVLPLLPLLPLFLCVLLCCCCCKSSGAAVFWCYSSSCTGCQYFVLVHIILCKRLIILHSNAIYLYVLFVNTVAFAASIYNIHGSYGHARSQGERQSTGAKPPLYHCIKIRWKKSHVLRNSRRCIHVTVVSLGALAVLDKVL